MEKNVNVIRDSHEVSYYGTIRERRESHWGSEPFGRVKRGRVVSVEWEVRRDEKIMMILYCCGWII